MVIFEVNQKKILKKLQFYAMATFALFYCWENPTHPSFWINWKIWAGNDQNLGPQNLHVSWSFLLQGLYLHLRNGCCIFWPEIIFFCILTSFSITNGKKNKKKGENLEKGVQPNTGWHPNAGQLYVINGTSNIPSKGAWAQVVWDN